MSFLFGSRPQLSSAEKIAAAETEVEMVSDMFNRYLPLPATYSHLTSSLHTHLLIYEVGWGKGCRSLARRNAYRRSIGRRI